MKTMFVYTIITLLQVVDKNSPSSYVTSLFCTLLVPAVSCNPPVSSSGVVTVTWCYIHTGGLPLTNVSLVYTFIEDSIPTSHPLSVRDIADTTSIEISGLNLALNTPSRSQLKTAMDILQAACAHLAILHRVGEIRLYQ